jgi:type VI secretion system protein ImpK
MINDQIYWACADVLTLAVQLPSATALPPASELGPRLISALDGIVAKGRVAGISDVDLAEARYALTAFMDEQILKSNWPGRTEWMNQPLQMQLYREYTAGENFFKRMTALMQKSEPSTALEIYYLCLVLGFRGAYGVTGDMHGLSGLIESARQKLMLVLPPPTRIAPNALPFDRASAVRLSNALVYALVAGCIVLVAGVLWALSFALERDISEAMKLMPLPNASAKP